MHAALAWTRPRRLISAVPAKRRPPSKTAGVSAANRRPEPSGINPLFICAGLAAINLIAYASVHQFGFVDYDDTDYITSNVHINDGLTWTGLRWALTSVDAANWHPLTWVSHLMDVQLFGMHPGAHHVVNLVWHIANTMLLFGVLRQLTGATARSAFVAALFAVHPLHVESVAWISERKDVMSAAFLFLTIRMYGRYVRQPSKRRYAAVAIFLALGLMAKPMLVTAPLVLLLLDVWPLERRFDFGLIKEKAPLFALSIASSVVTVLAQQRAGAVQQLSDVPLGLRAANVPIAYVRYIGKMIWPVDLAPMYPLPRQIPAPALIVGAALLLTAISTFVVRVGRRHRYLLVGWLWYVVALIPVIGIVQVGAQSGADRYTYLPMIGLFIIISWGLAELVAAWPRGRLGLQIASIGVVLACTVLSFRQAQYWRTSETLWTHAIEATKDNYFAHGSLGYVLWKAGKTDEAIAHYNEALRLRPDFAVTHNNLGVALANEGQLTAALRHFSEAVRLAPNYIAARDNLSATTARIGALDGEIARLAANVRERPNDLVAHNEFGAALAAQGRVDEAIEQFAEALRIDSNQADVHYNLGMMLQRKGRLQDAEASFRAALRHNPSHEAARQAIASLTAHTANDRQR